MRISKNLLFKLSITGLLWFYGCTYKQSFTAVLSNNAHLALDSIVKKYNFKNIDLDGEKIDGPGGKHTELTIKCINGVGVPAGDDQMSALARQIATLFKAALQDPGQFDSYKVLFVDKTVSGSETTSKFVGHEFKPGEIK